IEEAAPILNGDVSAAKLKVISSQNSINKNGIVSTEDLQQHTKKLRGIIPQMLVSGAAFLLAAGAGMPIGFSAVLLPQLQSNSSSIPTDDDLGSWIGLDQNVDLLPEYTPQVLPKGRTPVTTEHSALLKSKWEAYEEVHCVSTDSSHQRADIVAIDKERERDLILDPTVRMEQHIQQATQMTDEKKTIYRPHFNESYNIPMHMDGHLVLTKC
ncbi:hypothetical protein ANN_19740, partial [Periplaneta americana]